MQFFSRDVYEDSDLDLYVKSNKLLEVGTWLVAAGYEFEPNGMATNQDAGTSFADAVKGEVAGPEDGPIGFGVVYDFFRKFIDDGLRPVSATRRQIQVVSVREAPMKLILQFYSSKLRLLASLDDSGPLQPGSCAVHAVRANDHPLFSYLSVIAFSPRGTSPVRRLMRRSNVAYG